MQALSQKRENPLTGPGKELVNAMDGLNRYRFAGDAERLAAWESASTVLVRTRALQEDPAAPGTVTPAPAPGEVKPAA